MDFLNRGVTFYNSLFCMILDSSFSIAIELMPVQNFVCVCEREREREREGGGGGSFTRQEWHSSNSIRDTLVMAIVYDRW